MSKSPDAFRTISEVAEWLGIQAHVLRFWESKFTQVKPVKRAGGRRYYRPSDMLLLGGIQNLLHDKEMSIKDVQAMIREHGVQHVQSLSCPLENEEPPAESEKNVWDDKPRTSSATVSAAQAEVETPSTLQDATVDTPTNIDMAEVNESQTTPNEDIPLPSKTHEATEDSLTAAPHQNTPDAPVPSPRPEPMVEATSPGLGGILFDTSTVQSPETDSAPLPHLIESTETSQTIKTSPPRQNQDMPPPQESSEPAEIITTTDKHAEDEAQEFSEARHSVPSPETLHESQPFEDTQTTAQPESHAVTTVDGLAPPEEVSQDPQQETGTDVTTDPLTHAEETPAPTVSEEPSPTPPSISEPAASVGASLSENTPVQNTDAVNPEQDMSNQQVPAQETLPVVDVSAPVIDSTTATDTSDIEPTSREPQDEAVFDEQPQPQPIEAAETPQITNTPSTVQTSETQPDFFSDTPVSGVVSTDRQSTLDAASLTEPTPPTPSELPVNTATDPTPVDAQATEIRTPPQSGETITSDVAPLNSVETSEEDTLSASMEILTPSREEEVLPVKEALDHSEEDNTATPIDSPSDKEEVNSQASVHDSEIEPPHHTEATVESHLSEASPLSDFTAEQTEHVSQNTAAPVVQLSDAPVTDIAAPPIAPENTELTQTAAVDDDPQDSPSDFSTEETNGPPPEDPESGLSDTSVEITSSNTTESSISTTETHIVHDDNGVAEPVPSLNAEEPESGQTPISDVETISGPSDVNISVTDTAETAPSTEHTQADTVAVATQTPAGVSQPSNNYAAQSPASTDEALNVTTHPRIPLILTRLSLMPLPTSEEQTAIEDVVAHLYARPRRQVPKAS